METAPENHDLDVGQKSKELEDERKRWTLEISELLREKDKLFNVEFLRVIVSIFFVLLTSFVGIAAFQQLKGTTPNVELEQMLEERGKWTEEKLRLVSENERSEKYIAQLWKLYALNNERIRELEDLGESWKKEKAELVMEKQRCEKELKRDGNRREEKEMPRETKQKTSELIDYAVDPVLIMTKERRVFYGMTILEEEVFVICQEITEIEIYDLTTLSFKRSWELEGLIDPSEIVADSKKHCLYILDAKVPSEILRVDPNGTLLNKWSTGLDHGVSMSVSSQSTVIFVAYNKRKLNEYSPDGKLIREIKILPDAGINNLLHAVKLTNGQFVVSHGDDRLHRVCKLDENGNILKSFGGKKGSGAIQMNGPIPVVVERDGSVLVLDRVNGRVLLLSSDLEFKKEIFSKEEQGSVLNNAISIYLDQLNNRLFIIDIYSYNETQLGRIFIFHIK